MEKRSLRRSLLGLGAAAVMTPFLVPACATAFNPSSKVDALRIVGVTVDKPYLNLTPGAGPTNAACGVETPDTPNNVVTFEMEVYDGYGISTTGEQRDIQTLWLGGCFNPESDSYFLCYPQIGALFATLQGIDDPSDIPPNFPVAGGPGITKFQLTVPTDLVTSRPAPDVGPHYGIGYVFFMACAGQFGPVPVEGSGSAGSFPIGCFDEDGVRLGAESFITGYTQIYAFEDGRENCNPKVDGLLFDGEPMSEVPAEYPVVPVCPVPSEERYLPPSCTRQDPLLACETYEIKVDVPETVGEVDPSAFGQDGEPLTEVVWVDYYTDTGDYESDIKLINDAINGYQDAHQVKWIAPPEPGLAVIWANVRDARGGSTVVRRIVRVE